MRRLVRSTVRAAVVALVVALMVTGVATPAEAATTTTISGVVSFGTDGNHPAGVAAQVTARDAEDRLLGTVTTNTQGAYSVVVPKNASITLTFVPLEGSWQSQLPLTRVSVGTAPVTGINQVIPPWGSISGHVSVVSPSVPATAQRVRVSWNWCSPKCHSDDTYTDANGDYRIGGLANGEYTVTFWMQAGTSHSPDLRYEPVTIRVVVSTQQTALTNQDVTMPLRRVVSISGTVFLGSTSTPAGAGDVTIRYTSGGLGPPTSGSVTTDADGHYLIAGIPYDSYDVRFDYNGTAYADEWWGHAYTKNPRARVYTVDSPTDIDAVLAPSSTISGTVTNSSGTPLPGTRVVAAAYYGSDGNVSLFSPALTTLAGSQGDYVFEGLPAGDYTLYYHSVQGAVTHDLESHVGDVASGQSVAKDYVIYAKGDIAGKVTCAGCVDGTGAPRNLMDAQLESRATPADPWTPIRWSEVDLSGRYSFTDLYPGDYRIAIIYHGVAGYARNTTRIVSLSEGGQLDPGPMTVVRYANAIAALYIDNGGASGPLGPSVGALTSVGGGLIQNFTHGTIYASSAGGVHIVWDDAIRQMYWAARSIYGSYGWPYSDRSCGEDYCTQLFVGGQIYLYVLGTVTAPVVTGSPIVGGALSVSTGVYGPAAKSYTYAWLRDGVAITGATASKYVPVGADFGHTLQARVTASASGSMPAVTITAPTAAIGPIAQTKAPNPAISGTARVNSVLTATTGVWAPGTTWTYSWLAAGIPIEGETGPTLTLAPSQFGKVITVRVVGTHPDYSPTSRTSLPTIAVTASAFASAPLPTIAGAPQVGVALTADAGVWSPAAAFAYQWYANGVAVSGAKAVTFTPSAAQRSKKITVAITGTSTGYLSTMRLSTATSPVVLGAYTSAPAPTVTGSPAVGSTLTADTTGWDAGSTFSYRWYSDGALLSATLKTYVPTATQVGESIAVRVTTTTAGYPVTSRLSGGTAPVARGSFSTAPTPSITGAAKVGATLKAVMSTWSPAATLVYQWFADGEPIIGAESATFVPKAAQVGTTITVRVIGTKSGWTSTARISNPTAPVGP